MLLPIQIIFCILSTVYVTVEKLVFGGKALARVDGKTVFIPFALPQEELEITITANRRSYSEAAVKKVLVASPHRVEPLCPHFLSCGGCNLQMASEAYQRLLRQSMVEELLCRAHAAPETPIQFIAGPAWEYRNRFQFHRGKDGTIGMNGISSNSVVALRDCPIAVPALRTVIQKGKLADLFSDSMRDSHNRYHVFAQDTVYSPINPNASARVGALSLYFSVFGFFQSNLSVLEKLIAFVCDLPPCTRILDFYAGVGTFSAFLIGKAAEIHLVEHNKPAIRTAQTNLERIIADTGSYSRCFFHAVADEKWVNDPSARLPYDAALIDPPRQGVPEPVLYFMAHKGIPLIQYVSCNPATFARDAERLTAYGYRFTGCHLFDFYPQTHHCEIVGTFIR